MPYTITAAHGIEIQLSNGASTPVFTEIQGVHNGPQGPGFEPQTITARHHGSTDEYNKVTIVKKTPVTFDIFYDPADTQHAALITAAKDKTRKDFKMVLPDAGNETYAFGSYVSASLKGEVEGFLIYSITLNIDGAVAITP